MLFSALTVAVSLAAMMVFPQYFLRSFAYAGIAVVLLAAAAALILLPAALMLLGPPGQLPGPAPAAAPPRADGSRTGRGRRGAGQGVGPLLGARHAQGTRLRRRHHGRARAPGAPFLGVKFGTADDRQLPATAESRVVQEHIRDGFPGSPGGGLEVLAEGAASPAEYAAYREADRRAPRSAAGRRARRPGRGSAYFDVLPEGEAVGQGAQDLVRDLRAEPAPFDTSVTGTAAVLVDSKDAIADRLPWAVGIIVVVTLLLVFLLTGSVLIPLQAVVLNALSLTAMFGAVVWVFQDGNLSGLLSFTSTGDIETTLPC